MGERADEIAPLNPGSRGSEPIFEPGSAMTGNPASESVEGAYSSDVNWDVQGDPGRVPGDDDGDEVEATKAQIEETRSHMSETIDAIQEKLSPAHMVEQAKETVREATVGKATQMMSNAGDTAKDAVSNVGDSAKGFGSTLTSTVRQNPVPAALAALGLGWLVMSGRKQSSGGYSGHHNYGDRPYDRTYGYQGYTPAYGAQRSYEYSGEGNYGGQDQSSLGHVAGQAQQKAGQAVSQVQDTAGQVAGQVQDTAGQVVGQVQDSASQVASQAQYQAQRAASGFQQMLDERPLGVAAGAVVLGLAVGLSIPSTPQENRLMGEAKEKVVDQAQSTVQDAAQKAQTVVQEAVSTAKDKAQDEFSQQ